VIWKTCGRCEVDHVCPLACCGKDDPSNMVWLTVEENRAKGDDCIACQLPTPPPK
jgi:CRISPR/Cas system Type II protein with McrA/HNH and RuvC-like nuclease domain